MRPSPQAQQFRAVAPSTSDPPGPSEAQPEAEIVRESAVPAGVLLPRIKVDIFVESEELRASLEQAAADRRAVRAEFTIEQGSFAAAATRYRDMHSPDLIVVEQCGWVEDLDWLIEALADVCQPATRLFVIGDRNDVVLYRHLMRAGVSDYLFRPVSPLVFLEAIQSIFQIDGGETELGSAIAFVGARGGVGASTLAHNVAALLSRESATTTLLIDADLGFGTAALQFDVTPASGLGEALSEGDDLDHEVLERLVHWRDKRFGILAAPLRTAKSAAPRPDTMRQVVDEARRLAKVVVLDLPHGWAPWAEEALAAADRVVLVATADLPSLRNARTLTGLLAELRPNDGPPLLVLNRIQGRNGGAVSPEEFARILDCKVETTIPFDAEAAAAEMTGVVLSESTPKSEAAAAIGALAATLSDRKRRNKTPARRPSFLSRLLGRRTT